MRWRYPDAQQRLREIDEAQAALVDASLPESLDPSSIPASAALGSILPAIVMQSLLEPHLLGEKAGKEIPRAGLRCPDRIRFRRGQTETSHTKVRESNGGVDAST